MRQAGGHQEPADMVEGDGPVQLQQAPDTADANMHQVPVLRKVVLHQAHQHVQPLGSMDASAYFLIAPTSH